MKLEEVALKSSFKRYFLAQQTPATWCKRRVWRQQVSADLKWIRGTDEQQVHKRSVNVFKMG